MEEKLVLIADDQDFMRDSLNFLISSQGYKTILAADGKDALLKFRSAMKNPPSVELLITDLLMPGLNGISLITEVIEINPFLPVIIMSGGMQDDEAVRRLLYAGSWELIHKPFSNNELLEAIERAFDKSAQLQCEAQKIKVINSLLKIENHYSHGRSLYDK